MTGMELPPADVSWLRMEPVSRPLLRPRWTVQGHSNDTAGRDPFDQPTFRTRRRAERYARRHTCGHFTYTVHPVARCRCGSTP
jgi:hypothetical protein